MRRTSSSAAPVWRRSSSSRSSARAGSVRSRLRAASLVNAIPDRVGPRPSCRSRRRRSRSSSTAADRLLARVLQLGRERAQPQGLRQQGSDEGQDALLAGREGHLLPAQADLQVARPGTEWQPSNGCGSMTGRGHGPVSVQHRGPGQRQRLTDCAEGLHGVVPAVRRDQPDGLQRVGAVAEEELLNDAAEQPLGRVVRRREQRCEQAEHRQRCRVRRAVDQERRHADEDRHEGDRGREVARDRHDQRPGVGQVCPGRAHVQGRPDDHEGEQGPGRLLVRRDGEAQDARRQGCWHRPRAPSTSTPAACHPARARAATRRAPGRRAGPRVPSTWWWRGQRSRGHRRRAP